MLPKIIFLDTRESKESFTIYFIEEAEKRGYEIKKTALEFGDIRYGNICFERKEINDFCSSVCSNRLWSQLYKMKENPQISSIIIVSGTKEDLWKDNFNKIKQMEGAAKQIIAWGIPYVKANNDEELTKFCLDTFEYSKPLESPIKHVKKLDGKSIIMAFPGIGKKSMDYIKTKFNTIQDFLLFVSNVDERELQNCFGKAKGSRIFNAIREKL